MSDYISRQAVLDGIDKYIEKAQSTGTIDDFNSFAELVVKTLPSVENKGEWIAHEVGEVIGDYVCEYGDYTCSKCGHLINVPMWAFLENKKFCENCGADMRGET